MPPIPCTAFPPICLLAVTLLIFVSSQQKALQERIPTLGRAIEPRSISALVHAANIGLPLPHFVAQRAAHKGSPWRALESEVAGDTLNDRVVC